MPRALLLGLVASLFAALLVVAPGVASARGGAGVTQNLLEKGISHLRRAEGAWHRENFTLATREGRLAERLFRDVLAQAPKQRIAAMLAAQAATFAGDRARSHEWLEHFTRLAPAKDNDPDVHFLRAFVGLLSDKRPDRALRSLQRMYSLSPRARSVERDNLWYMALQEFGRLYLEAGKTTEAARQFATGARIARRLGNQGKEQAMLANLGASYMRADRFIEAAEVFGNLAKIDKNNALWHWRHGMALASQSQFAEAIKVYRHVIKLTDAAKVRHPDPEMREITMRLGNCLRHLGEGEPDAKRRGVLLDEAQANLEAYVKANPEDSKGHKWLGVLLYENREQPYKALRHFERAFALDPVCDDALRRMVQIHNRHPAPEGRDPDTWKRKAQAMEKDLKDGAKRRDLEREARHKKTGSTNCI